MSKFLVPAAFVFNLIGCASTTEVHEALDNSPLADGRPHQYIVDPIINSTAEAPANFVNAVKNFIEFELGKRSLLSTDNKSMDRKVKVTMTAYMMRSPINRAMFGFLAGKDKVESTIEVFDAKTDKIIGRSQVLSYNATAVGDIYDIARLHADEIVKFISGEKHIKSVE